MVQTATDQGLIAKNWRDLIRPRTLEVDSCNETYGKFVCEPLERGFGITLGLMRRATSTTVVMAVHTLYDVIALWAT